LAGGVAGAQFGKGSGKLAATGIGALLGGFLGSEAGASLDRADQMYYSGAAAQQVPNPYFRHRPHRYYAPSHVSGVQSFHGAQYGSWTASNCQVLSYGDVFSGAVTACQAPNGGWFIAR
jgi:surface antigen